MSISRTPRDSQRVVSFNRYTYPKREDPPVLTLDELRRQHERLIVPLLRTPSPSK